MLCERLGEKPGACSRALYEAPMLASICPLQAAVGSRAGIFVAFIEDAVIESNEGYIGEKAEKEK